jgi:hypothetical protein
MKSLWALYAGFTKAALPFIAKDEREVAVDLSGGCYGLGVERGREDIVGLAFHWLPVGFDGRHRRFDRVGSDRDELVLRRRLAFLFSRLWRDVALTCDPTSRHRRKLLG